MNFFSWNSSANKEKQCPAITISENATQDLAVSSSPLRSQKGKKFCLVHSFSDCSCATSFTMGEPGASSSIFSPSWLSLGFSFSTGGSGIRWACRAMYWWKNRSLELTLSSRPRKRFQHETLCWLSNSLPYLLITSPLPTTKSMFLPVSKPSDDPRTGCKSPLPTPQSMFLFVSELSDNPSTGCTSPLPTPTELFTC